MRMNYYFLILLFLSSTAYTQDDLPGYNQKELTIGIGLSRSSVKDARISARTFNSWSPKYRVAYTKINDNRISALDIQFAFMNNNGNGLLGLNSIRSNVNYCYQRKVAEGVWFGGFIDNNTLLNFPKTQSSHFNNNPISYTISKSIGPRITYQKNYLRNDAIKYQIRTSAQTSLLSYLIQPAWGHPYPSQFLKEGTFNPERNGMAWSIVKSGKVKSLRAFRSFRVELGFYVHLNNSFRVGLDMQTELRYANAIGKGVSFKGNDIMLGATYLH